MARELRKCICQCDKCEGTVTDRCRISGKALDTADFNPTKSGVETDPVMEFSEEKKVNGND